MSLRVIIAGGRDFDDYLGLCVICDKAFSKQSKIEIVCGMAKGADTLGERYGKDKGYKINYFEAKWDLFGKSAGYRRNEEMAKNADALIAFWDGDSKGTKHMIDLAKKYNLKVKVYGYKRRT